MKYQGICELLDSEYEPLAALVGQQEGAFLEVGTGDGIFAADMARRYPNKEIHVVDGFCPGGGTRVGNRSAFLQNTANLSNIHLFDGRSQSILPQLSGPYGLIFIDADHSRNAVLNDGREAWRIVARPGGLVFFHDYTSQRGVYDALQILAEELNRPVIGYAGTIRGFAVDQDWEPERHIP